MPTGPVRSLKAFKPHILSSLESYKGTIHRIIATRPICCHQLAVPEVEQKYRAAGRRGLTLLCCSSSPPRNAKKTAATCFHSSSCCNPKVLLLAPSNYCFRLHNNDIVPTRSLTVLTMETERGGKVLIEKNHQKMEEKEAKEEESLQKEQEKEEQERKRARKEHEMEEKIGPPPEKPLAGDCCGQGCEVCVWDTYWDELDQYKKLRKAAEESA